MKFTYLMFIGPWFLAIPIYFIFGQHSEEYEEMLEKRAKFAHGEAEKRYYEQIRYDGMGKQNNFENDSALVENHRRLSTLKRRYEAILIDKENKNSTHEISLERVSESL